MQWFGSPWDLAFCQEHSTVETPIGETCGKCKQPITRDDCGLLIPNEKSLLDEPWHLACFRQTFGGQPHAH